jgi:hypothetical protein
MNFENLSQTWQNQHNNEPETKAKDLIEKAKQKTSEFKKGQIINISILSISFLVLVGFYIGVEAYQDFTKSLGLVLMIVMLFTRIALEIKSKYQLQNIDSTVDFQDFVARHRDYFKNRKWIHFVFTPLIYILYAVGFISMLPVFKENLSSGFFLYIQISGIVVFVVLAVFIAYHIRKELQELHFLKKILQG